MIEIEVIATKKEYWFFCRGRPRAKTFLIVTLYLCDRFYNWWRQSPMQTNQIFGLGLSIMKEINQMLAGSYLSLSMILLVWLLPLLVKFPLWNRLRLWIIQYWRRRPFSSFGNHSKYILLAWKAFIPQKCFLKFACLRSPRLFSCW